MKSGFVTIIGKPNSGKSTLLNNILKEHISITSKKPQTTRKNAKGIYNDSECQIVFIDTPGVHDVKDNLDKYMDKSIKTALKDVDVVIVLIDIVDYKSEKDIKDFVDRVIGSKKNIILCVNKIDLIQEEKVHDIKSSLEKVYDNVIFVSSLKKKNIDSLIAMIKDNIKDGDLYYPIDTFTDMTEKEIVGELVREQCLYKLDKEIPHGIVTKVSSMTFKSGKCVIDCDIICEKDNHKGIIIGKGGSMLKNIGYASRVSIEKLLGIKVFLNLNVKVKENWKEDYSYLKDVGFDIKDL